MTDRVVSGGTSWAFIAHLRIVSGCVEFSEHDAAEGQQRSLSLFVRQQTPKTIDRRRPEV
jgi:hypothetical protein